MDELPQIINILKGEMSFVGPRPEMPFIVEQYDDIHRERLKVLPGITGLWQLGNSAATGERPSMKTWIMICIIKGMFRFFLI